MCCCCCCIARETAIFRKFQEKLTRLLKNPNAEFVGSAAVFCPTNPGSVSFLSFASFQPKSYACLGSILIMSPWFGMTCLRSCLRPFGGPGVLPLNAHNSSCPDRLHAPTLFQALLMSVDFSPPALASWLIYTMGSSILTVTLVVCSSGLAR